MRPSSRRNNSSRSSTRSRPQPQPVLLYQVILETRDEKAGYEQFKADWLRTYYSTLKIVEKIKRRSSDRV
jgi:hypothetical protein